MTYLLVFHNAMGVGQAEVKGHHSGRGQPRTGHRMNSTFR